MPERKLPEEIGKVFEIAPKTPAVFAHRTLGVIDLTKISKKQAHELHDEYGDQILIKKKSSGSSEKSK